MTDFWEENKDFIRRLLILFGVSLLLYLLFIRPWHQASAKLLTECESGQKQISSLYPDHGAPLNSVMDDLRVAAKRLSAVSTEMKELSTFQIPPEFILAESETRPAVYLQKTFASKYQELRQFAATRNVEITAPDIGFDLSTVTDDREEINRKLLRLAIVLDVCYAAIHTKFREITAIRLLDSGETGSEGGGAFIRETRLFVELHGPLPALIELLGATAKKGHFLYVLSLEADSAAKQKPILVVRMELAALSYFTPVKVDTSKRSAPVITGYR